MEEITKTIAQALVDAPEDVSVTISGTNHTSILRLRVGYGDAGKIIGRQGRTADAFRTILNAVAAKGKRRVILEIADDLQPSPFPLDKGRIRNRPIM
jgi:predicted RNA-binding protein YlqC (UPF0109 family)